MHPKTMEFFEALSGVQMGTAPTEDDQQRWVALWFRSTQVRRMLLAWETLPTYERTFVLMMLAYQAGAESSSSSNAAEAPTSTAAESSATIRR